MKETKSQEPAGGSSKKKSAYLTVDEWMAKMRLAFTNGKLPAILPALETVGYSEDLLDNYLQKIAELAKLHRTMQSEYAERKAETGKFEKLRVEINEVYVTHRGLVKVVFKKNIKAIAVMRLHEPVRSAYSTWIENTENFYQQIESDAEFSDKVASVGINSEIIAEMQQKLTALRALKKSQSKETAEAQNATEARDKALDELKEIYTDFITLAKLALKDNQALEAIGVVVKR